jgi:hypothetical protein
MLAGSPRTAQLLEGGLTNVNVKVTTPDRMAVLRLSSSDGDLWPSIEPPRTRLAAGGRGSGAA